MTQQTNNNIQPKFTIEVLRGFFDADGSFHIKVESVTDKEYRFAGVLIFTQKDDTVLENVLHTIQANNHSITSRDHPDFQTESNCIVMRMNSPDAKLLLDFWETNPPVGPTKYLDYRIARVLEQTKTMNALAIVDQMNILDSIGNKIIPSTHRVASLSLLYLRYQTFAHTKGICHPKTIPITEYHKKFNATPIEIQESEAVGQALIQKILDDRALREQNLVVSEDYLLGLHMGDGTFYLQTSYNKSCTSFTINIVWGLTDCKEHKPLLKACLELLETNGVSYDIDNIRLDKNSVKVEIRKREEVVKIVNLFTKWSANEVFPNLRLNQFKQMSKAVRLITNPNFRQDPALMRELVEVKWKMNPDSGRKKGTIQEEKIKLEKYLKNKRLV